MARASAEEQTTASALIVAMLRAKHFDEAMEFWEWYLDNFDVDLGHLFPAELEEELGQ